MAPSARPQWLQPNWWADGSGAEVDGKQLHETLLRRLYADRAKRPMKDLTTEVMSWSSALGKRGWVRARYTAVAIVVGTRSRPINAPESWLALSHLVVDHSHPLGLFTEQFAEAAMDGRPGGLTDVGYGLVRNAARRVPVWVRVLMCEPALPDGTGGVIESPDTVQAHYADADGEHRYTPAAMRGFAWCLLDALLHLDDPDVVEPLRDLVDSLESAYGRVESPPRKLTAQEEHRIEQLLEAEIARNVTLRADTDDVRDAYGRARVTLANRIVLNKPITRTQIMGAHLHRIEKDRERRAVRERTLIRNLTVQLGTPDSTTAADALVAAYEHLSKHPELVDGGVSWERALALRILDSPEGERIDDIDGLVHRAWDEVTDPPPPAATTADVDAAAARVLELLQMALTAVGAGPRTSGTADRAHWLRARRAKIDNHRQATEGGEDR